MASKPTVELTFAGDEKRLTEAMDRVGQASDRMASEVDSASGRMDVTTDSFDRLGEATDSSEGKFQGFADTITGTSDIMTGFSEGDIVLMATGFADLAGGLTEFLVPAMSSVAGFMMGPLRAAMSFIAAHPLLIALGVLIGLFVTLWTTSETFRNVVSNAFNTVAGVVRNAFGAAISWVKGAWDGVIGFFRSIPDAIGRALGTLGSVISSAFKAGVNVAIDGINWAIDRINDVIYGANLINPFDDIPPVPHISRLHAGGVVPGRPGSNVLTMLQAGERVQSAGENNTSSGPGMWFSGNVDSALASAIMHLFNIGEIQVKGV